MVLSESPSRQGTYKEFYFSLILDILIRDLWTQGTDSINDIRVVNTDAVFYQSKNLEKFLETADMYKNLHDCINERRNFSPFVASVDGLLGVEVEVTLKRIASRLT